MKIIEGKTMTCQTCDTTFEYDDEELMRIPSYPCMAYLLCPNCKQQIIMIADEFREADKRIFVEEENGEEKEGK